MAILNDLIVRGATRCLNTLYTKDLNTEDLTITGYTYMGNSTARDDTKLSVAGISNNSWYRSTGEVGWQSDTYGGGIYMTDATYVRTYGSKAFLAINGLYTGASAQYYLNSSGKLVVNEANANSLSTKFASVSNTLRATKYDLQTVTQMGTNGTLYVAPSIQFPTSNGGTTVMTTANSITITDTNITSATLAGIVWGAQAKVKISGTFNGVVSGTVDGVVTSINTTSKVLVIGSLSGGNWSSVPAGTYTASQIISLNITMYENASSKPVGILLTSYGAVSEHTDGTAKTYIDIYGGSNTKPVVRIGQMTNLDAINGVTPNGWGLYTTHGYFSGLIVSNEGKIGGWTLGSNALTTGTWGTANSAMLCTGSDISKTIADSGSISGWVFTAGANFGVTKTGAMYCTGAKVNGNITAQSLTIANNATITGSIPQTNVANLSTSLTNAAKTATNFISTVDSTGIMVHPNGNTTTGWKISNAIELLRNNDSHMKLWIDDNSVAKIRIGKEDSKHVLIDDDSVDIVDNNTTLASFGEVATIGQINGDKIMISPTEITGVMKNNQDLFRITHFPVQTSTPTNVTLTETTQYISKNIEDQFIYHLKFTPIDNSTVNWEEYFYDENYQELNSRVKSETYHYYPYNEGEIEEAGWTEAISEDAASVGSRPQEPVVITGEWFNEYGGLSIGVKTSTSQVKYVKFVITYMTQSREKEYAYYTFGDRNDYMNAGDHSFVQGIYNTASGKCSHAEGESSQATGDYSHAECYRTKANGNYSHSEGYETKAVGGASHAEGKITKAYGVGSHAEGRGTSAGNNTTGNASHAEGFSTIADADYSHAQNIGTIAGSESQTVMGRLNIVDRNNKYALIIGNGNLTNVNLTTDTAYGMPSNAFTVSWEGNVEIALDTTASSGTTDADLYNAITALGWGNDVLI